MDNVKRNIANNENNEICSKCGGACCKRYGGSFHPSDFGENLTYEDIEKILIGRNDVSIDWVDNPDDEKVYGYFLRMRHVGGGIVDPSWGERCVHLTPTGCDLPFDQRAYGCKRLTPIPDSRINGGCTQSYKKAEAYSDWKEYWDILNELKFKYDTGNYTGSPLHNLFWWGLLKDN